MKHRHKKIREESSTPMPDPVDETGQRLLSSLHEIREAQEKKIEQALQDLCGQNAFLRQQLRLLHNAVGELLRVVSAQCAQSQESEAAKLEELRKLQAAGPHMAITGLFHKLFRDLLRHMNQMDDFVRLSEQGMNSDAEESWFRAIRVARDNFEGLLLEWGCSPLGIHVGQEIFDPEIHEAVPGDGHDIIPSCDGNRVVKVVRRGWLLHGTFVQHPQVIVG